MMKKTLLLFAMAAALLSSCKPEVKIGTAYLSMEFSDTIPELLHCWVYDHQGVLSADNSLDYVDDRTAVLAVDSISGFADVDVWTFYTHAGVRIVPDDTIHLTFSACRDSLFPESVRQLYPEGMLSETTYATECLNPVKDNDIVNDIMKAYNGGDILRYAILSDAGVDDSLYIRALAEHELRFDAIQTKYGRRMTKHLSFLADLRRAYMMTNMRSAIAIEQGVSEDEVPGSDWYYSHIEPNALAHATMSLTNDWMEHEVRKTVSDGAQPQFAIAMLDLADRILTNPAKAAWIDNWSQTQLFGLYSVPFNEMPHLWERYCQVCADCPEVLAKWQKKYEKMMATAPGKPVNDIILETSDGTEVLLSSLFGKMLYIDVWATWCAPCCAEIPHIEKLAEQFNGSDKIAFVSLSVDNTADPWLKKINDDKPSWPQYRLTPEHNKQFSADWDIQTIPRFLIIAPDGTICNANAPRPSDPRISAYIEELLTK